MINCCAAEYKLPESLNKGRFLMAENQLPTLHYEKKIDKTLYRVTNIYKGEIELHKAIEELIIQKVLKSEGGYGTAERT